jgi:hypothetical protein
MKVQQNYLALKREFKVAPQSVLEMKQICTSASAVAQMTTNTQLHRVLLESGDVAQLLGCTLKYRRNSSKPDWMPAHAVQQTLQLAVSNALVSRSNRLSDQMSEVLDGRFTINDEFT